MCDALLLVEHRCSVHARRALVVFCSTIAERCYLSLNEHLPVVLKVLVVFAAETANDDDDHEENNADMQSWPVGRLASHALDSLTKRDLNNNNNNSSSNTSENAFAARRVLFQDKFSMASACIDELLMRMPRLMHSQSANTTSPQALAEESTANQPSGGDYELTLLKRLYGYLRLVSSSSSLPKRRRRRRRPMLGAFFRAANTSQVRRLAEALMSCVRFDYSRLANLYELKRVAENPLKQQQGDDGDEADGENEATRAASNYAGLRTFLDNGGDEWFAVLTRIGELLGRSDAARLLIDELLLLFRSDQTTSQPPQLLFLIYLILVGVAKRDSDDDDDDDDDDCNDIVNATLSTLMNEFTTTEAETTQSPLNVDQQCSVAHANERLVRTCLLVEAVRLASRCCLIRRRLPTQTTASSSSVSF